MSSTFYLRRLRQDQLPAGTLNSDSQRFEEGICYSPPTGPAGGFVSEMCRKTHVMSKRTRKILILAATLLFFLLATQALLFIHLLCEEHHAGHDSHKCPVCQQLLTLPRSITVEEQITISQAPLCKRNLIFRVEVIPAISTFHILGPRAPPVVS